jgi:hypothetical protein
MLFGIYSCADQVHNGYDPLVEEGANQFNRVGFYGIFVQPFLNSSIVIIEELLRFSNYLFGNDSGVPDLPDVLIGITVVNEPLD